ncbi:MAG: nucleoside kinase [Paludibacteraceae bacterium]|nr:nucleoside kinase [Paludibacteraceae bacterium]
MKTVETSANTIQIFCKNTQQYYDVPRGSSLLEIYEHIDLQLPYVVVAAIVNYRLEDLNYYVYKPKNIEFVDISSATGMRCYVRTLSMVLSVAIHELYPGSDLRIEHPISKGYYCRVQWAGEEQALTTDTVRAIRARMQQIVDEDRPIVVEEKRIQEVTERFAFRTDGAPSLFKTQGNPYVRYFRMGDYVDYYNDVLVPSTGYLRIFDLEPYFDGMLLRIPNRQHPDGLELPVVQDKMFGIFSEYLDWNKLLGVSNVGELNAVCKSKSTFDMIKLAEALHEKKVTQIADMITHRQGGRPKFVLISGPSSSGKTTFSKRLSIQLQVNGLKPVAISMDNYFVNRVDTPLDENGEYDFEHINALDLPLFRQQLQDILDGKEVSLPTYNFEDGKRYYLGNKLKIEKDNIIILEGNHALNPDLIPNIPRQASFRIYVSALTTINVDNHNWIPTTDTRLIRRIVRDYRYRNYTAQETIARCPSVVRGEEKWIYPFQENADVMFNSALIFELSVLKRHALPILAEVPKYCAEYAEAYRLLNFLSYFEPIQEKEIPPTSMLREFVGGSSFRY